MAMLPEESSLQDLLTQVYQDNPNIQTARMEVLGVHEGASQALSGFKPTLSGTASFSSSLTEPDTFGAASGESEIYSLEISQPLYRGGSTSADLRLADRQIQAQWERYRKSEQQIFLKAIEVFLNVIRDQEILSLNENNENVLNKQLEAEKDRFSLGAITRTDVSQAASRLAAARAARILSVAQLRSSQASYAEVAGEWPKELSVPVKEMLPSLPETQEEALNISNSYNPDIIMAGFNYQAAEAEVRTIKGGLLPSLDLKGKTTRTYNPVFGTESKIDSSRVELSATIPLYTAGKTRSKLRQAKYQEKQKSTEIHSVMREVKQRVITDWEDFIAVQAEMEARQAQIDAAEIALEGVKEEAILGSRTTLDVLDAEQELLDARVKMVVAQHDYFLSRFGLMEAMGTLDIAHLGLRINGYNFETHYKNTKKKWLSTSIENGMKFNK